jgi:polysaccharide biosynthesis transport protein
MAEADSPAVEPYDIEESVPQPSRAPFSILPDPSHLWAIFRRRLKPFLLAIAIVMALVAWRTLSQTPEYMATASVVIEPRKTEVTHSDTVVSQLPADTNVVDTEVQILSSPGLASRVASMLKLEQYPEYRLRQPAPATPVVKGGPGLHPLANRLLGHVRVQRQGLSLVISITASSEDPQLAALIANTFAQQYIAQQEDNKNAATREASAFLQKRLTKMREEVNAASAAEQRYKIEHGLMSAQGSTLSEQEVSTLNQQIAQARADAAEKMGRLNAARAQIAHGGGGADVGAALQSPTVSDLRRQEADASRILADLTSRYGDLHPDVQKQRHQLSDIRAQMKIEIDRVISSLSAEAAAAQSRLDSLVASRAAANGQLASANSAQVGYDELDRLAEAQRTIYNAYLNRSKETMSQEGLMQPDARVVALSRVPNIPYSPNYVLAVAFALVGGVLAGLVTVAAAEYFDRGIRTKLDVEQRLRVRYLGAVPELRSTLGKLRNNQAPEDYLLDHPMSSFAEAIRSLKANLAGRSTGTPQVVAITSALPGEGKSTTSVSLARIIAQGGARTVLVDCDIRRRYTSGMLLPDGSRGLLDYMNGKIPLADAVVKDRRTDLAVLGTTEIADNVADLFTEQRLPRFFADLRAMFDVVIIDTSPLLGVAESRLIAASADATIMLARWRSTSISAADAAVEILLSSHAKLRGVALTLVDIRKYASTGQGDTYYYHKKFVGYYAN